MNVKTRLDKVDRDIRAEAERRLRALSDRLLIILSYDERALLVDHIATCETPEEWLDPGASDPEVMAVAQKALNDEMAEMLYKNFLLFLGIGGAA